MRQLWRNPGRLWLSGLHSGHAISYAALCRLNFGGQVRFAEPAADVAQVSHEAPILSCLPHRLSGVSITDILRFWKSRVIARTRADTLVQADPELVAEIASNTFIHTDSTLYAFTCLKRATLDPDAWDWQPFAEFSNIQRAVAELKSEARWKSGFPFRTLRPKADN